MLSISNQDDIEKMKKYHRASDMVDFLYFFPEVSYLEKLAICFDENDYLKNKDYFDSFDSYRIDSPKEYSLIEGIEANGLKENIIDVFKKIKEKNKHGVLLFFDVAGEPSKRYQKDGGISVNINLYEDVCIEVVGKGFDGREISKGICVHERYLIPWFDLKSVNIDNFNKYRIYKINDKDYYESRKKRIDYLLTLGEKKKNFINYIPVMYEGLSNEIWENLIQNILVNLWKKEEIFETSGFLHFAIGGNIDSGKCFIWQMYNKDRFN